MLICDPWHIVEPHCSAAGGVFSEPSQIQDCLSPRLPLQLKNCNRLRYHITTMALTQTNLEKTLPLIARGKVRDVYSLSDNSLLFVATDRISAYDVVMKNVSLAKFTG